MKKAVKVQITVLSIMGIIGLGFFIYYAYCLSDYIIFLSEKYLQSIAPDSNINYNLHVQRYLPAVLSNCFTLLAFGIVLGISIYLLIGTIRNKAVIADFAENKKRRAEAKKQKKLEQARAIIAEAEKNEPKEDE